MKSRYAALCVAPLALVLPMACHSSPPAEPSGAPAMSAPTPAESAAPAETPSAAAPSASAAPEASAAPSVEPAPAASGAPAPMPSASATTTASAAGGAKKPPTRADEKPAAAPADTGYTGEDACTTKNFHYGALKAACHTGGRKAAKGVMKGVVQKARAGGADLQCTSCHVDTSSFQLKPNAVGDLKKWL